MIPEGWQELSIGQVCSEIIDCVNKTATVVAETTPFKMIRTTNVRNGRVDTENVRYVTEETFRIWTRRGKLQTGDIILTREAPVGEVGQLVDAAGMFLGQRTMLYRADPAKMEQSFLFQLMISPTLKEQYVAASAGGTVHHIRVPDCSKFLVNVPPLPEQQKIADILSTWDKAMETTEALLANARTQKRALMQSLLTGTRRFPGFEGQPWREVRLGDVAEVKMGSSPKSEAYNSDGIGLPLIQGNADISGGRSSPRSFTSEITQTCEPGDILISVRAPVGTIAVSDHKACVGRGAAVVTPRLGTDWNWLYQTMHFLEGSWSRVSQGSTFDAVNSKEIKCMEVLLPTSASEQEMIGKGLHSADEGIRSLEVQLTQLRTEKKSLMQQLLTGKRRVMV